MYLSFYGLTEKPFTTTPDPRFLYLTPGHREALAQLVYGVQESTGFLVLTGEVGTGKTTLLQAFRGRLDGTATVAFLVNSTLPFDGILEYALADFGIDKIGESRAQRLIALNLFLIERWQAGQKPVLILDEAQNLDPATLEEIRLLSNFETATQKLLQIVLVGQPELRTKLDIPELRQLKQRIGIRCTIPRLTPQEIREYIRSRLRIAGSRDLGLFSDRAISRIAEYAEGIPRVVNIVCDHCLLIGYADQRRHLDRDVVEQAIRYLDDGQRPRRGLRSVWWPHGPRSRRLVRAALAAALLVIVPVLATLSAGLDGAARFTTMLVAAAHEVMDRIGR